jgi:hypothetical protein
VTDPFQFERRARDARALALVALSVVVLLALVFLVGAAWWIPAGIGLLTLPAAVEVLRDARSGLVLDGQALSWSSGRLRQRVPLARIAEVHLATTLDFSQRATLRLDTGERLRIPPQCIPPRRALDDALAARGLPHRRSLFAF